MVICYGGHRKLICPDQETDTVEHREAAVGTTQPTELVAGRKPAVPAPSLGAAGLFLHPDPDDAPSLDQTEPSKQPRSDKPPLRRLSNPRQRCRTGGHLSDSHAPSKSPTPAPPCSAERLTVGALITPHQSLITGSHFSLPSRALDPEVCTSPLVPRASWCCAVNWARRLTSLVRLDILWTRADSRAQKMESRAYSQDLVSAFSCQRYLATSQP